MLYSFVGFPQCLMAYAVCVCRCIQRRWHCAWCNLLAQGTIPVQGSLQTALSTGGAGDRSDGGKSIQQPASSAVHLGVLLAVCPTLHQASTAGSCTGRLSCACCTLTACSMHTCCSLLNTQYSILTTQYLLLNAARHSVLSAE